MATGRKTVVVGQVIDPDTWGNLVWDQSVQTFASAADRTAQFATPLQGAVSWLEDVKRLEVFDNAAWQRVPAGKATAVFTPDPSLWVSDAANPSACTRVGDRWCLTFFVRNKSTGALGAGTAVLGSVDASARVATGLNTIRAAGFATMAVAPNQSMVGIQHNAQTGALVVNFPAAIPSQSANTIGVGGQVMWDAY